MHAGRRRKHGCLVIAAFQSVLAFIISNMDLIATLVTALENGTPKAALMAAIKASMIEASNAAMKAELTK